MSLTESEARELVEKFNPLKPFSVFMMEQYYEAVGTLHGIELERERSKCSVDALSRVSGWLEKLATQMDQMATSRFESYNDACKADAKNYRATKKIIDATIAAYESSGQ